MKENFQIGEQYDNQKACMEVMLDNGVIPVVNENDTVCVTELMFTDNDELSGLIARMMNAKTLILLSNIDGIYDGDPSDSGSSVISKVRAEDNLEKFIQTGKSSAGRGGMASKYNTARSVAESGIRVIIANGNRDNILPDVLTKPEETIHTEFVV
jgi:glutamate 5-kinase